MSDTQQTTSTSTGQGTSAGTQTDAKSGAGQQGGSATKAQQTASGTGSVLGDGQGTEGDKGAQKNATGGEQGQTSGEPNKGAASGAELEVKLPEGVEVDAKMLEGFKGVAKEVGLDSEKASKLATWYAQQTAATEKAQVEAHAKQGETWLAQLKSDPDFGGANFESSVADAKRAMARFGGDGLSADLEAFGLGNLPSLVRTMARIGKAIGEDSTGVQTAQSGRSGAAPSRAEYLKQLYNNSQ